MPPYCMVTNQFLRQVLKGEKKLLKASEVSICNPPRYDEVSVSTLYEPCLQLDGMAECFPDRYPKGRACNREYFFTILATKQPEYTQKLLQQSKQLRFAGEEEEDLKETIEVDDNWAKELKAFPSFSSKCAVSKYLNCIYLSQSRRAGCCIF